MENIDQGRVTKPASAARAGISRHAATGIAISSARDSGPRRGSAEPMGSESQDPVGIDGSTTYVGSWQNSSRAQLIVMIERMQYQNEILSKEISILQRSVIARDTYELSMTSIISEIRTLLEEIAGLSSTSLTECHKVSVEEESRFMQQVEKESASSKQKLTAALVGGVKRGIASGSTKPDIPLGGGRRSSSAARDSSSNPGNIAPAAVIESQVMWTKVRDKLQSLEMRWTQSRRDCRLAVVKASIPINSGNNKYLSTKDSAGSRIYRSPNKTVSPSGKASPDRDFPSPIPLASIPLRRVLGISVPLGWNAEHSRESMFDIADSQTHLGLDMKRIHNLQNDLLKFSNLLVDRAIGDSPSATLQVRPKSNQTISPANLSNYEDMLDRFLIFPTEEEIPRQVNSIELMHSAQELVIHLAALAPFAPLTLGDESSLSSEFSSFELLHREIRNMTTAKQSAKAVQNKLLPICERGYREQIALVRSLFQSRAVIKQWSGTICKMSALLDQLSSKLLQPLQTAAKTVTTYADRLNTVIECLTKAEVSRISNQLMMATGSEQVGSIFGMSNPLDMLARGALGAQVAELINSLRLFCGADMAPLVKLLYGLQRDLHAKFEFEIKHLRDLAINI